MDLGGNAFRETVDETRPLNAAGELTIENVNGTVRVASWDEASVRIEAVKAARSERALERIEVRIEGEGDRVTVRTHHPKGPWMGGGGKVDYNVRMPRGARLSVRNVNGKVEIQRIDGAVSATTVNGSLEADDLGGPVNATSVNGSVNVDVDRVDPTSRNSLRTTNGSVRLTLPANAAAEIEAGTVNGSAHCDFDLQDGGRVTRRRIEGRIGAGGARFELGAVNGSLHVDRGLSSRAARPEPAAERAPAEAPVATAAPAR